MAAVNQASLKKFTMAPVKTDLCESPAALHLALKASPVSFGTCRYILVYTRSLYRRLTSVLVVVFRLAVCLTPS